VAEILLAHLQVRVLHLVAEALTKTKPPQKQS
jgi:hypothetical protein